jgi:hypothetical protein
MQPSFALLWRRDGSEDIKWYIHAIQPDGSFYGSIRHLARRRATGVSGTLSAEAAARCRQITARFHDRPTLSPGPCFALLARWVGSMSHAEIVFKFEPGDEATSEDAREFLGLKGLLEEQISAAYCHLV